MMNKKKRTKRLPWNWRDRIEVIKVVTPPYSLGEAQSEIIFQLRFKKGQAPKGFHYTIGELFVECSGHEYNSLNVVGNANIIPHMRNRGLGKLLYLSALDELGHLSTYYHSHSYFARRVWQSLMKKFKYTANFWNGTLTIHKLTMKLSPYVNSTLKF